MKLKTQLVLVVVNRPFKDLSNNSCMLELINLSGVPEKCIDETPLC